MTDPLNPKHYTNTKIEPMDVIEDWELPHHLACVLKYIKRHREKGKPVEDLKKAEWYLCRYILHLREQGPPIPIEEAQRRLTKWYNDQVDALYGNPTTPWEDRDRDAS